MTAAATGAATPPPVPGVPSMTTATAIWGASAGAKPMNQALLRPSTPVSAVPVFPATERPLSAAWVPVPSWTTRRIIPATAAAVVAEVAVPSEVGLGGCDLLTRAGRDPAHQVGAHECAAVGDRCGHEGHLQWRYFQGLLADREACGVAVVVAVVERAPSRKRPERRPRPRAGRSEGDRRSRRRSWSSPRRRRARAHRRRARRSC